MKKVAQISLVAIAAALLVIGVMTIQRLWAGKSVAIANNQEQDAFSRAENAQEQAIQLDGNGTAPLFVQEATVKQISAEDFSKLTGKVAEASRVFSIPQARLLNTSGKVIKEFSVMVRNEKTQFCKIFTFRDRELKPGDTFQIRREDLDKAEKTVSSKPDGKTVTQTFKRSWGSENMWVNSDLQDVYLAIGYVKYDDGTQWIIE